MFELNHILNKSIYNITFFVFNNYIYLLELQIIHIALKIFNLFPKRSHSIHIFFFKIPKHIQLPFYYNRFLQFFILQMPKKK